MSLVSSAKAFFASIVESMISFLRGPVRSSSVM